MGEEVLEGGEVVSSIIFFSTVYFFIISRTLTLISLPVFLASKSRIITRKEVTFLLSGR